MKYELWFSKTESSYALLFEGDSQSKASDARVVFVCEADTYEEALQQRNDFLGWGKYRPLDGYVFDYPPRDRKM